MAGHGAATAAHAETAKQLTRMYEIQRIDVWSTAKIVALFSLVGSLIGGVPIRGIFELIFSDRLVGGFLPSLIGLPLSVGLGLGVGALFAVLYNWLGAYIGFIQVDLALEADEQSPSPPQSNV